MIFKSLARRCWQDDQVVPSAPFSCRRASAPAVFIESASADRGRVFDKSNSATSLTQGLSAPLKLSKTRRLVPKAPSRRLTLRVTAATNANTRKVVKRARKERLNGDLKDVDTMRTFIGRAGEKAEIGQLLA